jgi:Putative beta-barrel porin-2, OmpL-like. bbp2
MHTKFRKKFATIAMLIGLACVGYAQDAPAAKPDEPKQASTPAAATAAPPAASADAAPAAPTPLPTPSTSGPLQMALPINIEAGPLGTYALNGAVSGIGVFQNNAVPGNNPQEGAFSNAMIFFQKPTGWFQFYVQAGAYDVVSLGSAFISNSTTNNDLWGPVPVVFVKLVPAKNTNIMIGALPTLIGAESTFDFQNMNIERGLLWNQENAVNRGVQVNQTMGKFTASLSYNDGFYSNRYNWLSGALTYTNGPHTLMFVGMGNLGQTNWQNLATPIQNNSMIYNLMYTYTKGPWVIEPYVQYTDVPTNLKAGIPQGASTWGGAILASRILKKGFSLAGRWEYISSSGNAASNSANLMYGPGSTAWSLTATPTYQYKKFFTRTDISYVSAGNIFPGSAFGTFGLKPSQTRGVVEIGYLF